MNYKGLHYTNTLTGFKKWCKDFPPMSIGIRRQYFHKNGIYMSLEIIEEAYPIFGEPYYFVGKTFRRYDEKDKDFTLCDEKEAFDVFFPEIERYTEEHNVGVRP